MSLYAFKPNLTKPAKELVRHLRADLGAAVTYDRSSGLFRVSILLPVKTGVHRFACDHDRVEDALWLAYAEFGMNLKIW